MRVESPDASNRVTGPTPETPDAKLFQNVSRSLPRGLTTPIPVTTTRRFTACPPYMRGCPAHVAEYWEG